MLAKFENRGKHDLQTKHVISIELGWRLLIMPFELHKELMKSVVLLVPSDNHSAFHCCVQSFSGGPK